MISSATTENGEQGQGTIITFYSYKGGTGRSMALANVAWVLASNGKKVLAIDWDLEAPGLHRYFAPFLVDKELNSTDGLIDFVNDYATETMTRIPDGEKLDDDWYREHADILQYAVSLDWEFPDGGTLDLVPAGRQGSSYSTRVNLFNWQNFYDKLGGGAFLEAAKELMRSEYDYILIDSRTGVSDTSGICTVQMPDSLVVCFTLNNQSVEGAAAVANSAFQQRSDRPLRIFPVTMRVEPFEKRKLEMRKEFAAAKFARFPAHLSSKQERDVYIEDVQFQYLPFYAYEEILASFGNKPNESLSLLKPAERLASYLTDGKIMTLANPPDESKRQEVLALYEGRELGVDPAVYVADAAMSQIRQDELPLAQKILKRMVRVARPQEGSENTPVRYRLSEFGEPAQQLVRKLAAQELIKIEDDPNQGEIARLAYDSLIKNWKPLKSLLDEDLEFLLWRQKLNSNIADWQNLREDRGALLTGAPLQQAKKWKEERGEDLNESELNYISRSIAEEQERIREELAYKQQEARHASERTELEMQSQVLIEDIQKLEKQKKTRQIYYGIAAVIIFVAIIAFFVMRNLQEDRRNQANDFRLQANENMKNASLDDAIKNFTKAIEIDPTSFEAYLGRGNAYWQRENSEKNDLGMAIADFDKAIELKPDYTDAFAARGSVYAEQEKYDQALSDFNQVIKLNPTFYDGYIDRGEVYEKKNQLDVALQDYNKAIEISNTDPRGYVGRGRVYAAKKQFNDALVDFDRALTLDQNNFDAYLGRGNTFLATGFNSKAIGDYDQANRLSPYNPELIFNRGQALRNLGNIEKARDDFNKILDLTTNKPELQQINLQATNELKTLGQTKPPVDTPTTAKPKIYLHYQDTRDRRIVNNIKSELSKNKNFVVDQSIDLVTQATTGDVRYFYDEDEAAAKSIKRIVEDVLLKNKIDRQLDLRPLKPLADRVPQGWIEVWLPSLQQAQMYEQRVQQQRPYRN